jgi:conjugal transfer pilus assembly protein TraV
MKKKLIIALMGASMASLSGCASLNTADKDEFGCTGHPGVICKTPVQVYEMTSGALPENGSGIPDVSKEKGQDGEEAKDKATGKAEGAVALPLRSEKQLQPVTGAPMPVREQARVMRIWVAPWVESKTDALHWPSYVYVEVEPRKWSFGVSDFRGLKPGIPLVRKSNPADVQVQRQDVVAPAPGMAGAPSGAPVQKGEANLGDAIPSFD